MNQNMAVGLLIGALIIASLTLIAGINSGWLVAVSGLLFVAGGTLLTAILSEGYERIRTLIRRLPLILVEKQAALGADEKTFLQVATLYRRGSVRQAEMTLKGVRDPFLQLGTQLIVDRCNEKELARALKWHTSSFQEQERRDLRILQSMSGFAPAFGMLGTLLGLVRLLFNLGDSGLDLVGSAMGFAMITTVYGLVICNLVIKPVVIKLEQRLREQLAWQRVKYEMMVLLFEKAHPAVIEETLSAFKTGRPVYMKSADTTLASAAHA
jgi:chemotaxis protein MotA